MDHRTSFFQYARARIQLAASLFRPTLEGGAFAADERVPAEPYMESLPTQRSRPRRKQASRLTGLTQMGMDA